MKLNRKDINALLHNYFNSYGYTGLANTLKTSKDFQVDEKSPLAEVDLCQALKRYLIFDKEMSKRIKKYKSLKKGQVQVSQSEESDESEESSESEGEEQEEILKEKKFKKEETQNKVQSEEDDVQDEGKNENAEEFVNTIDENQEEEQEKPSQKKGKQFNRIDPSIASTIPAQLKDNSYWAKSKFGTGDAYGEQGYIKFQDKKGKNFRKEKTKFKNKNFHGAGGRITGKVNSIKF